MTRMERPTATTALQMPGNHSWFLALASAWQRARSNARKATYLGSGHRLDNHGPRLGSLNAEHTRAVQTKQAASGHDAAGSLVDGGDVALHCSLPHRVLQLVQAFDLQASELIDGLDGLGLQRVRDHMENRATVFIAKLRRDLFVGQSGSPELNGSGAPGGGQGSVPMLTLDAR